MLGSRSDLAVKSSTFLMESRVPVMLAEFHCDYVILSV